MSKTVRNCIILMVASGLQAFGMYNIHSVAGITEGGIFGSLLLLDHWLHISPAISSVILNGACYLWGFQRLGKSFVFKSFVASAGYSLTYGICEQFPPLWPQLAHMPLLSSVLGALFIGIGAGICVRIGGATSGDDALAMCIHDMSGIGVEKVYLCSDLCVLLLSLSYIPFRKIFYSLLTVIISGQIIGLFQREKLKEEV